MVDSLHFFFRYSEELKAASSLCELLNYYVNESASLSSRSLNDLEDQMRHNVTIHEIINDIEV
jgi:hypothetical protein